MAEPKLLCEQAPALNYTPDAGQVGVEGSTIGRSMNYDAGRQALRPPALRPDQQVCSMDAGLDYEAAAKEQAAPADKAALPGEVTAEQIAAERAKYDVQILKTRVRKFVNPKALSMYPVKSGGERSQRFGALVAQAERLYELLEKIDGALPADLAKAKARQAKKPDNPKLDAAVVAAESTLAAARAKAEADTQALLSAAEATRTAFIQEHEAIVAKSKPRMEELAAQITRDEAELAELAKSKAADEKALKGTTVGSTVPGVGGAPDTTLTKADVRARKAELNQKIAAAKKRSGALDRALKAAREERGPLDGVAKKLATMQGISLVLDATQIQYHVTYTGADGAKTPISLGNSNGGINVERPQGFYEGGSVKFTEEDFEFANLHADLGLPPAEREKALADAKGALNVIRKHEGNADSLNTWDRAVITLGPGLAAFGVLESVFARVRAKDPEFFQAEVASLGVGVKGSHFTYRDPKGGVLVGEPAKLAMAADPIVMAGLRRVFGHHNFRRQVIARTYEYSVGEALHWNFAVTGDNATLGLPEPVAEPEAAAGGKKPKKAKVQATRTIAWKDVTADVDSGLVNAAITVIASFKHAAGNTSDLKQSVSKAMLAMAKAQGRSVDDLMADPVSRAELVRIVVRKVRDGWEKYIKDEFGSDIFTR